MNLNFVLPAFLGVFSFAPLIPCCFVLCRFVCRTGLPLLHVDLILVVFVMSVDTAWGSVQCVATLDFYQRLVLVVLVPIAVVALLGSIPYFILWVQVRTCP